MTRPSPEALLETIPTLGEAAYPQEVAGLVYRSFTFSEKYGEQQGRADRFGAQPEILEFERKFIKNAFKLGIPLFAHSIVRGSAEQNELFRKGVSKAKAGDSAHNYGAAVDIIHGVKAWQLTKKQWLILGHLGHETARAAGIKVVWGGDWKKPGEELGWDPAHWELAAWREIRRRYADGEDYAQ